ncbi:unnamed protein product [Prunus armeniaca]
MEDFLSRQNCGLSINLLRFLEIKSSAATTPALMDYVPVGPRGSQVPASSAASVVQPVSPRRCYWPASTTDTTSTDATAVSGSQLGIDFLQLRQEEYLRAVSAVEDGEDHSGDQQSYQHRIRRVSSDCIDGGVA